MKFKNTLLSVLTILLATAYTASAADFVRTFHKKTFHPNACKALGDNFINIPGTSTCINIYGQITAAAVSGKPVIRKGLVWNEYIAPKRTTGINNEGRIGFETASPSSLGPIHTRVEMRGNLGFGLGYIDAVNKDTDFEDTYHGNNLKAQIHFAYADIGQWRFGIDESIFNYWTNNFGTVENDSTLNPMANTPLDSISYKFKMPYNISAIIGIERSSSLRPAINVIDIPDFNLPFYSLHMVNNENENANLVAGLKYNCRFGDISGVVAYDGTFKKTSAKLRIDHIVNKRLNLFGLVAAKTINDVYIPVRVANRENLPPRDQIPAFLRYSQLSPYGDWGGKWEVVAGGSYIVNPKTTFNAQIGYTGAQTAAASANIVYTLAKNFTITPELSYIGWHDSSTHYASFGGVCKDIILNNVLKGKHEIQALVKLRYKF